MGHMGQLDTPDAQGILLGMAEHTTLGEWTLQTQARSRENSLCGRPGCGETGRFGLQGSKMCSLACLWSMLRTIVLAEQAETCAADQNAGPRVQFGQILIAQGSITEAQLEQALRSQRATGAGNLGSWLKQQAALSEADCAAALSIQWQCPVFRLGNFAPRRMAAFLPQKLAEKHRALALRVTGESPRIAICFEDHIDAVLLRGVERMHGIPAEGGLLTAGDFWQGTRELLGAPFPRCSYVSAPSVDEMAGAMSQVLLALEAPEARLIALGGVYWLRIWQSRLSTSDAAEVRNRRDDSPSAGAQDKVFAVARQHGTAEPADRIALDVLCAVASPGNGVQQEPFSCEHLANRMLAGLAEEE